MSNIFRQNTTGTYSLLKYKRQHVSVLTEPSSGQFDSLGLCTLSVCVCVHIMVSLSVYNILTARYENSVQSPSESNWLDDGSIGTETCCLLYFNKLYVSVVF
jgi:hypothetical protein